MRADLVIVGGGPAGLATAIHSARAGLAAVLVEARSLPLDKACGEGIMPAGVAALRHMGVRIGTEFRSAFCGIRYVDSDSTAEGRFPHGVGWGVRRPALTLAMAERAVELGADLRYGCRLRSWRRGRDGGVVAVTSQGEIAADLLVGADGLHSRIRKQAGLAKRWRGARRLGTRRHFAIAPWTDCVEVHLADDAEAYVTPVGREEIGIALMWSGETPSDYEALLARFPKLVERLGHAPVSSVARGAGPFRQGVRRRYAASVALVGDAAGYLDPLTGEGITLGLLSARALVETVACRAPLAAYERAYRALSRRAYRMTALVLAIAERPALRRRVVAMLARSPDLFDGLLAVNDGAPTWRALGLRGAARLVGGIAAPPRRATP